MRVYVAGSSKEIERVRGAQAVFTNAGHTITYDWTVDYLAQIDTLQMAGEKCTEGVRTADLFYLCIPRHHPSIGAWVELGIAWATCAAVMGSGKGKIDIWRDHLLLWEPHDHRGLERALKWMRER